MNDSNNQNGSDAEQDSHQHYPMLSESVWLGSSSRLAKYIGRPIRSFTEIEFASGVFLLAATILALLWANSPWQDTYFDFWHTHIDVHLGSFEVFVGSMESLVNDCLMVLFFFMIGLEIKREMVVGHLRNPRNVLLPAVAAVGGMAIPALVFVAFNWGGDYLNGWAIPTATDIAFVVGIMAILGDRIPRTLKIFILTLAIVDDIGAILIIAIFYSNHLSLAWLSGVLCVLVFMFALMRMRVWYMPLYIALGILAWWMTYKSGVHPTIAGVAIGIITPAAPLQSQSDARKVADWLKRKDHIYLVDVRWANFNISESVSIAERVETFLHPMVRYLVVPIFALANAGVIFSIEGLRQVFTSDVALGIMLGLVVGKAIGVGGFTWIAMKLRLAKIPFGMTKRRLLGLGIVAGIGFTVSLFVSNLSFTVEDDSGNVSSQIVLTDSRRDALYGFTRSVIDTTAIDQSKIGILIGSLAAALLGIWILSKPGKPMREANEDEDDENSRRPASPASTEDADGPTDAGMSGGSATDADGTQTSPNMIKQT